jgi:XRE family transcriptional regulator, aerobic/anaerobic benzoate catabolism transcriptional regulator
MAGSAHYNAQNAAAGAGVDRALTRRKALLSRLGAAVRARRSERRFTLRALASRAGVSQRFLVQLEAGEGNISVARLEDVAEALGTTAAELLTSAARPAAAPSVVALIGLRGAGKSSVGKRLAERLQIPFVELDEAIAREAGMTLPSIFEIHGEGYYRSLEREVLRRILDEGGAMVLAAGGSIVTDVETWELLRRRARTVWLRAEPQDHWDRVVLQGDARPMRGRPRAMNELRQLLAQRSPLYAKADAVVDTSALALDDVVERVAAIGGSAQPPSSGV